MWKPYLLVIYMKYVYSAPCHIVDASHLICGIHEYTSAICTCQIFGICAQFVGNICFWHMLAITCEVDIVGCCVLAYVCKMLGPYAHLP